MIIFKKNRTTRLIIFIILLFYINGNIITPVYTQQINNNNNNNNNYLNNNNNNNNKSQQQLLPTLRFSKNIEIPNSNEKNSKPQLKCVGGTAMGSNEEVLYLICKSSLADIFSRDVVWKCHPNTISKNVQLFKLRIDCPKPSNYLDYIDPSNSLNLGNNHPCTVEYHLDWVQYSFSKVIGWSSLGLIFFYILLNRNNNLYNAQINNPMSLPREQINPKVFRALGIIVCVIVFLSTLAFSILCLYMFSAPI